jgi:hypothetical protein
MEIEINYSKAELEAAVKFLSKHNTSFLGKDEEIRQTILDYINKLSTDVDRWMIGTMGFVILAEREFEGINSDKNTIYYEILINPAVSKEREYVTYLVNDQEETC